MRYVPLLVLIGSTACAGQSSVPMSNDAPRFTLRTYNVNYGGPAEATLAAIGNETPDIVMLQETTAAWESKIRERWGSTYAHIHFHHSRGAGGLAVLSKWPIPTVHIEEAPGQGWFPAMIATVDSPYGSLTLLNVHLRPPFDDKGSLLRGYFTTPSIRKAEVAHYATFVDQRRRVIVAGDFNEASDGAAVRLLADRGLVSVPTDGEGHRHTWRWRTRLGTARRHLDHVMVDPTVLRPVRASVLDAGASDHLPVDVTFAIPSD